MSLQKIQHNKIIKNFITNKNSSTFGEFYKLYYKQVLVWVASNLYTDEAKSYTEDLTQELFLLFWKSETIFSKFTIHSDEDFFLGSFNKYLRFIVRRNVAKFFKTKEAKDFICLTNALCIDELEYMIEDKKMKIGIENIENLKLIIEKKLLDRNNRGNRQRDIKFFFEVKFDDIPVYKVAQANELEPNAVSIAILRIGREIKSLKSEFDLIA